MVDSITADASQAVVGLRPAALDVEGLIKALRLYADQLSSCDKIRITVKAKENAAELPAAVDAAAYLIATEAMTNVVRHAAATERVVSLRVSDTLELSVADNGKGLTTQRRLGVGLTSMRERAEELGGELLSVHSMRLRHGDRTSTPFPHSASGNVRLCPWSFASSA